MTDPAPDLRPYRDSDEPGVLECLTASLGAGPAGRRPPEFFRWKHLQSPFGRSFMLVAEADGRVAGLRAFMRWRFRAGAQEMQAVRAVDTATHPSFQGRGIFRTLTLTALDALRDEGVDFVFNTPNDVSLQGYLKMGWQMIGRVPIRIRIRRPVRFVGRFRKHSSDAAPPVHAPPAAEVLSSSDLEPLLARAAVYDERIHTVRDAAYLRWRYGDAPLLDYRAVSLDDDHGVLRGIAIFRVRPRGGVWGTTLSELITDPLDYDGARALLRSVARAAPVDVIACHFARGSAAARAVRRAAYLRAPGGMTFVANPLRAPIRPDPTQLDAWALSSGDLEVF